MNKITFENLLYAYIRGYLQNKHYQNIDEKLLTKDLFSLTDNDKNQLMIMANNEDIKTYYFKEKEDLARVNIVLGFLKNISPTSLLDVGSGRGVFLFPLLREFSNLDVTSIDILPKRIELLENIKNGGISNLTVLNQDIISFSALDSSYDVVTLLEVLEHIPKVELAIKNAIRIARRFIVITVPSKPDNNPEHIHLLTKDRLTKIFNSYGISNLKFGGVNGHLFLIAKK